MKQLVILRHGEDDMMTRDLSVRGERQMLGLGQRLRGHLRSQNILVFSSPAQRAQQSAQAIAQALGVQEEVITATALGDEQGKSHPDEVVRQFVERNEERADVIILVCHLGTASSFGKYFFHVEVVKTPRQYHVEQGSAMILDLDHQIIQVV